MAQTHLLDRIDFDIAVPDLDTAMACRSRIETLVAERIPTTVARLFDGIGLGDQWLEIDRLDLDLGQFDAEDLEARLPAAFEAALSDALTTALAAARQGMTPGVRLIPEPAMLIARFEEYLLTGVTAMAAGGVALFEPRVLIGRLIDEQPVALTTMLRRVARHRHAIERLILQAQGELLSRLLDLLAPADAAIILTLMEDYRLVRSGPMAASLRTSEAALDRLLWTVTIEFLLHEAGSHFNRQRYLAAILRREAEQAGLGYASLLQLLAQALPGARSRAGGGAQFAAALEAVIGEQAPVPPASESGGTPSTTQTDDQVIAAAARGEFDALLALVRRHLGDDARLRTLVTQLPTSLFHGLVRRIDPTQANAVIGLLDELRRNPIREPTVPGAPGDFDTRMHALTLRYLLRDRGSQFNRRRFLALLLEAEARAIGMDYVVLLQRLAVSLERERIRTGVSSSLPGVLDELLAELGVTQPPDAGSLVTDLAALSEARAGRPEALIRLLRGGKANDGRIAAITAALEPQAYAMLIRRLRPDRGETLLAELNALIALHAMHPVTALSPSAFARTVRTTALRLLIAGDTANATLSVWRRALMAALTTAMAIPPAQWHQALLRAGNTYRNESPPLRALLEELATDTDLAGDPAEWPHRHKAGDLSWLVRHATGLTAAERAKAVAQMSPGQDGAVVLDILAMLARWQRTTRLIDLDDAGFGQVTWALAMQHLVALRGGRLDRRRLGQALLAELARYGAIPPAVLGSRLRHAAGMADPAAKAVMDAFAHSHGIPDEGQADGMGTLERYLLTGQPASAGQSLPSFLAHKPDDLAALVRRLARTAPGRLPEAIARLLEWLLPDELVHCLSPTMSGTIRHWMEQGGIAGAAEWQTMLASMLRDERLVLPCPPEALSVRLDRLGTLSLWLDRQVMTAPSQAALAAHITELGQADLGWLLTTGTPERTLHRLVRLLAPLETSGQERILARLAPWAVRRDGVLGTTLALADPVARRAALYRAAVASLEGQRFDLQALIDGPALPQVEGRAAVRETPPIPAQVRLATLLAWLDGAAAPPAEAAAMVRHLLVLQDGGDAELAAYFERHRPSARARKRWARLLPVPAIGRVLQSMHPAGAGALIDGALSLHRSWRKLVRFGERRIDEGELWAMLMDVAVEPIALPAMLDRIARSLAGPHDVRIAELKAAALQTARDSGQIATVAALRRPSIAPEAPPATASRATAVPKPTGPVDAPKEPRRVTEPTGEPCSDLPIYVANAGLVLLAPYLPTLFNRLAVLSQNDSGKPGIVGLEARSRAVHLLQYLADGRLDRFEPALVLNKVMCGLSPSTPVAAMIESVPADIEICDDLLRAVIQNWTMLGNTSLNGLRETFLQREGRLSSREGRWDLKVERKGVDVLVGYIPWSFGVIYHPWMTEPVHVTW